jgi:hypothetical protein
MFWGKSQAFSRRKRPKFQKKYWEIVTPLGRLGIYAQKMLEKKRASMPHYLRHSELVTNIIRKSLRIKDKNTLKLEESKPFIEALESFLRHVSRIPLQGNFFFMAEQTAL